MLLFVRIKPNQRFDKIEKKDEDWHLRLKAPAIDGKANEYLISFLSKILGIPKSSIVIRKGLTSSMKYLDIDADAEMVQRKLQDALDR